MRQTIDAIRELSTITREVILFHSAAGKDSIALLDLMYPYFDRIVCVYMYMVKDLEHINKYIIWAKSKYSRAEFIQVPHYVLSQYRRDGHLGCAKCKTQRVYQLKDITRMVKRNLGIDWAVFGFKKSDSLNRRLMLNTYRRGIFCDETKNAYPLSPYKNGDVEKYIKHKRLIPPIVYGGGQSQGTDIGNLPFLLYCKRFHPKDYKKIISEFPHAARIVFDYENYSEDYE